MIRKFVLVVLVCLLAPVLFAHPYKTDHSHAKSFLVFDQDGVVSFFVTTFELPGGTRCVLTIPQAQSQGGVV